MDIAPEPTNVIHLILLMSNNLSVKSVSKKRFWHWQKPWLFTIV